MITASGTRKISKAIAVGLSISMWSWGLAEKWRRTRGVKLHQGAPPTMAVITCRSLDETCQRVNSRPDLGSKCLKRHDASECYESSSDGILRELKPAFVFQKFLEHGPLLPSQYVKAVPLLSWQQIATARST